MLRTDKENFVSSMREDLAKAAGVLFLDFSGLTVAEAVDLEVWSCAVCTQLQAQTGISPAARALELLRGAMGERAVDVVFQDPGHLGLVFPQVGLSPAACAKSSVRLSRGRCAQGVIPLTVARVEDGLAKVPQTRLLCCSPHQSIDF